VLKLVRQSKSSGQVYATDQTNSTAEVRLTSNELCSV
jgi:hypothetical protein